MGVDGVDEKLACRLVCLTAASQTALTSPYPMCPPCRHTTDNTPAPPKHPPKTLPLPPLLPPHQQKKQPVVNALFGSLLVTLMLTWSFYCTEIMFIFLNIPSQS